MSFVEKKIENSTLFCHNILLNVLSKSCTFVNKIDAKIMKIKNQMYSVHT